MATFPRMNLAEGATPWGKAVELAVKRLETQAVRREQGELNANKGRASTVRALSRQVAELVAVVDLMPVTETDTTAIGTFSATDSWTTLISTSMIVPAGKTRLDVTAIGSAAAADMTSGGAAVCYARIGIGAVNSVSFSAAKDSGASVVNNIMSPSYGRSLAVTGGDTVNITLQVLASHPTAFQGSTSNVATLTVIIVASNY